jgi:membrane protein implicated in regulation of membrane protease activity
MSYAVEWIPGVVVVWTVLVLLVVPEFAVIAVVVLALAALVALVALAAAALVSPYLLVRSLRRRLAQPTTRRRRRWIDSPSASPSRSGG